MRTAIDIRSTGFKRYFANTSWLMGHRVLSMIVALFVGVYVARYLGPERFGLLSYAGSFVGLSPITSPLWDKIRRIKWGIKFLQHH